MQEGSHKIGDNNNITTIIIIMVIIIIPITILMMIKRLIKIILRNTFPHTREAACKKGVARKKKINISFRIQLHPSPSCDRTGIEEFPQMTFPVSLSLFTTLYNTQEEIRNSI